MGKTKKRSNKLPPFVPLTWEMLNHQALIDLNHLSRAVLPYFIGKVKAPFHSSERYNTEFSFPYSEGKRFGFPYGTFAKAIRQLVAHGFIDPVEKGGCYGDLKKSNKFRLSLRWQHYGSPSFIAMDWQCFIPKPRKNKYTSSTNSETDHSA